MMCNDRYTQKEIEIVKKHLHKHLMDKVVARVKSYKQSPAKKTPTSTVQIVNYSDRKPGNWYPDQLLPSGWKYCFEVKDDPARRNGYKRLFKYKSEGGQIFKSSWQAMQYLRTMSNKYKSEEDDVLEKLAELKQAVAEQTESLKVIEDTEY